MHCNRLILKVKPTKILFSCFNFWSSEKTRFIFIVNEAGIHFKVYKTGIEVVYSCKMKEFEKDEAKINFYYFCATQYVDTWLKNANGVVVSRPVARRIPNFFMNDGSASRRSSLLRNSKL